jgi:hypothetical protein
MVTKVRERYPAWSAAGGVVCAVTGAIAVTLWLSVASHSWWELGLGALWTLLALVGFYWMIAALAGSWPFHNPPVRETPPETKELLNGLAEILAWFREHDRER